MPHIPVASTFRDAEFLLHSASVKGTMKLVLPTTNIQKNLLTFPRVGTWRAELFNNFVPFTFSFHEGIGELELNTGLAVIRLKKDVIFKNFKIYQKRIFCLIRPKNL